MFLFVFTNWEMIFVLRCIFFYNDDEQQMGVRNCPEAHTECVTVSWCLRQVDGPFYSVLRELSVCDWSCPVSHLRSPLPLCSWEITGWRFHYQYSLIHSLSNNVPCTVSFTWTSSLLEQCASWPSWEGSFI